LGSGLVRTGFIAAVTVTSLVAKDLLGSVTLSGLPAAAATIGVALGTTPIAALMARRGRRVGIASGLFLAAVGAVIGALAISLTSFPLFVFGTFVIGLGMAGDRLSRYAASDISTEDKRAFSIAIVVWAGTIGSIVGPALLDPVKRVAESLGLEGLIGPYLLTATTLLLAFAAISLGLRPDPLSFVEVPPEPAAKRTPGVVLSLLNLPSVRFSIIALAVGQVVMVLIMTMTPIHIDRAGDGLGTIGLIIAAHTFGMFALSPLTGWVADRVGRPKVILTGHAVLLISALLAANASGEQTALLFAALLLLGVGWNFSFIAGSAYLSEHAPADLRVPLEGLADTVVWSSGAAASLSSGVLLGVSSYAVLCLVGASIVILPVVAAIRFRDTLLKPAYAGQHG
jgi:MFS family permease